MKRFWIILGIVVIGLGALFVFTKPDTTSDFDGDATQAQADDHFRNESGLPVSLIEYADFQCPSCAAYHPTLKALEEEYKDHVSFGFRHFPIISIHPNAFAAARASEAASNQGKFWEMHDKLFETQSLWGQVQTNQQSLFEGYAEELDLDMEQFRTDYASEAVATRINSDVASARQFDILGTPTFILNGEKIESPSFQDMNAFREILDEAIRATGGTPPATADSAE